MSLRMKKELIVGVLVLLALVGIFFPQFKRKESTRIPSGRKIGTFTATEAVVTGDRNKTSFVPLSQSEVDGVERFVMFIGYARSGSSIIGAMIDAHPNVVIAHEYDVCLHLMQSKTALFNSLYRNSYKKSEQGNRSQKSTKKGYNLHINTPWQGSFSQLRVIGDKKAGKSTKKARECLNVLKKMIKIPIVMFQVIRNPFDMIATSLAIGHGIFNTREMVQKGKKLKLNKEEVLSKAKNIFLQAEVLSDVIHSNVMEDVVVVEIHSENFIKHPQEHINRICEALDIPCPVDYVEACSEKVFSNVSMSRQIVDWDNDVVESILTRMKNISFFSSYTLDSEGNLG